MFMYLPFLLAMLAMLGIIAGWSRFGYVMWLGTLGVTLYWFAQSAATPLTLSL
ncbi:DUF5993 family protein [Herbaspirillum sp. alder98]|uniref:DUF5993 family protein n=1 Tax=Herbaspirillum sp. alder98 TaxID=2913096 RepID=UPI001CD8271D|nr:DUF5993 family protein [Herbaspirillum sp. alder98]MCA1326729.1 DUF5993 family protein [Herbaspirillum sp. alder98]